MPRLRLSQLEDRSTPATLTWVGDVSGNWNDSVLLSPGPGVDTNWSGDVLPQPGDTLIFPAGPTTQATNNDTTAGNNYTIQVTGGAYTIAGNAVTLGAGGLTVAGGSADVSLALGGASGVTVNGGTLTFSGAATNTYTGDTVVNDGTLQLNRLGGLPVPGNLTVGNGDTTAASVVLQQTEQIAGGATVTVNADGTFQAGSQTETINQLTVNAGAVVGPGALIVNGPVLFNGGAGNDTLALTSFSATSASASLNGGAAFTLNPGSSVTFNGNGGNDTLTDFSTAGFFIPPGGLFYDGGPQAGGTGDSLALGGRITGSVVYTFGASDANGHAGTIDDGGGRIVTFTGLEPITNAGNATDVVFNLPAVDNTAVLESPAAGVTRLRSVSKTFEDTTFVTPTGSITVNGNAGVDSITFTGVGPAGGGGPGTTPAVTLTGGGGNDSFTVNTGGTTGSVSGVTINGGAGTNTLSAVAGAGNDALGFTVTGAQAGTLAGVGPAVTFANVAGATLDGGGGTNTVTWTDQTGGTYGTPTDPSGGIFVAPDGPASGNVTVGSGGLPALRFLNAGGGLNLFGGINPFSGPALVAVTDRDSVTVLGVSTTGLQSAFGEATAADGADIITLADTGVTVRNATLGNLVPVTLGEVAGEPTFAALYLRAGNELGPTGDAVTATPSSRLFLYADGMNPRLTSPGDQLVPVGATTLVPVTPAAPGQDPVDSYAAAGGASVTFTHFENQARPPATLGFVVGSDAGGVVTVYGKDAQEVSQSDLGAAFTAVRVAAADFNNDGVMDAVVGSGIGLPPQVAVVDGKTQQVVSSFTPFEATFTGGVFVAAGDINADGIPDIVVAAGTGGGPRVQVYLSGSSRAPALDFIGIEDANFRGGARVAVGDVNADGFADFIVTAGPTGGPRVAVYDGRALAQGVVSRLVNDFFAMDPATRTGIFVAAGDINGDGYADLVFGPENGGAPRVTVFDGLSIAQQAPALAQSFFAGPEDQRGGIRVAVHDVNGDGKAEVITGAGVGAGSRIQVFDGASVYTTPKTNQDFDWVTGLFTGVFVG